VRAPFGNQQTDTAGKRLELLREVVPDLRRLAIMANVGFPDLMGGDVTVASEAGKGSVFTMRLPVDRDMR
jgi:hypothetical protein